MADDPRSLMNKYCPAFPPWARLKGTDIVSRNLIDPPEFVQGEWRSIVRDSGEFLVAVGKFGIYCECPFFNENGFCKHSWALLWSLNRNTPQSPPATPSRRANWHDLVNSAFQDEEGGGFRYDSRYGEHLVYRFGVPNSIIHHCLEVELYYRDEKKNGQLSTPKAARLVRGDISRLPDAEDRAILAELLLVLPESASWSHYSGYDQVRTSIHLGGDRMAGLVRRIIATGRAYTGTAYGPKDSWKPAVWNDAKWRVVATASAPEKDWVEVNFGLTDGGAAFAAKKTNFIDGRIVMTSGCEFAEFEHPVTQSWLRYASGGERMNVPRAEWPRVFALISALRHAPAWDLPEHLRPREIRGAPSFRLKLRMDQSASHAEGTLTFIYPDPPRLLEIADYDGTFSLDEKGAEMVVFDQEAHANARRVLRELSLKPGQGAESDRRVWQLPFSKFAPAVRELVAAGWEVLAEGKPIRSMTASNVKISSGIDWFEVRAMADFDGQEIDLPALLAALKDKSRYVKLGDGSVGLLPEDWIQRYAPMEAVAKQVDGAYRFKLPQAALLDALLDEKERVLTDEPFEKACARLKGHQGLAPAPQPEGFTGTMRPYQCEGLAWLDFLASTGLGGCLADDMGVGKTIQMLAQLERFRARREAGESLPPDLVVVPKSLLFNWVAEARKFTPKLRLLDYTGIGRDAEEFLAHDVILTTYGTLRRDITSLKDFEFNTIVLDEAQAIKNAASDSSKATRLLTGRHHVAMTGTPVENHIGELWSLFSFLNPGLLGANVISKTGLSMEPESRAWLRKALRPLILRRTKQQVASDLPERTEQVLYCELEPEQRKLYNSILARVRKDLKQKIKTDGLAKSKLHVLEALLRLRQAACHPKLLDEKTKAESAKFEVLLENLDEVIQEGHKVLVFSQFTSLLGLLKPQLDKAGFRYEYLDGSTSDRKARVEHFQSDPDCPIFLLSLKAGGTGLNLTAADYVFLLDPWWNPAVEAQAIDRTHRIGQTRPVFAYRIVARDTIEERILELQQSKRDLAEAILGEDNAIIANLKAEDLDFLLS